MKAYDFKQYFKEDERGVLPSKKYFEIFTEAVKLGFSDISNNLKIMLFFIKSLLFSEIVGGFMDVFKGERQRNEV